MPSRRPRRVAGRSECYLLYKESFKKMLGDGNNKFCWKRDLVIKPLIS
jgi:hypothetical protein